MIEVRQEDREAAATLRRQAADGQQCWLNAAENMETGSGDASWFVQAFAVHRQQAEDAMRRRCLSAVEEAFVILPLAPGLADGASKAFSACEAAIRGIDAGGEGE